MYQKYKRQHPTVEEEKRDQRQVTKIREREITTGGFVG
jgi:hypothetical protein